MKKRVERAAEAVIDKIFGRRWLVLSAVVGLTILRLSVPKFWQDVLWWTYCAIALVLLVYFVMILRREGDAVKHEPVEEPE